MNLRTESTAALYRMLATATRRGQDTTAIRAALALRPVRNDDHEFFTRLFKL